MKKNLEKGKKVLLNNGPLNLPEDNLDSIVACYRKEISKLMKIRLT